RHPSVCVDVFLDSIFRFRLELEALGRRQLRGCLGRLVDFRDGGAIQGQIVFSRLLPALTAKNVLYVGDFTEFVAFDVLPDDEKITDAHGPRQVSPYWKYSRR